MSDENIKEQRDRYASFAFAAADLFIEVSEQGKILHAVGAAKTMTGIDDKSLIGRNWLDLFSAYEISKLQKTHEESTPERLIGPVLVTLNEQIGQKIASFSAIRMPKNNRFYIMLGVSNDFVARIAPMVGLPGTTGFAGDYAEAARDAVFDAHLWGQEVVMTFFDFVSAEDMQARFGKDGWGKVEQLIGEMMAQYSFGGHAAGQISEGHYSFIHDKNVNLEEIQQKILDIAAAQGISPAKLNSASVTGDLKAMDKTEIARALEHTIKKYAEQGSTMKIDTLNKGYTDYLSANAAKLKELKATIDRVSFGQHFQAIVNMKTKELLHYEVLTRFEQGETADWIRFAEDAGLAPDLDLAVCQRAIQYIRFKSGGTRIKFSIDISPRSMISPQFVEKIKEQLAAEKGIHERLHFKIFESCNITDIGKTAHFLKYLRDSGFKTTFCQFRPGASAQQYIETLKPDYIKIAPKFLKSIQGSPREEALLINIIQICKKAGTEIIADGIDDKAIADMLIEMGIKYGQGLLYAPPSSKPDYIAKS